MDPKETLKRVFEAIAADDLNEALASLEDYVDWRRQGGFRPEMVSAVSDDGFAVIFT